MSHGVYSNQMANREPSITENWDRNPALEERGNQNLGSVLCELPVGPMDSDEGNEQEGSTCEDSAWENISVIERQYADLDSILAALGSEETAWLTSSEASSGDDVATYASLVHDLGISWSQARGSVDQVAADCKREYESSGAAQRQGVRWK